MPLGQAWILDVGRTMTLISLVAFVVSTWLAVRAEGRRVKRIATSLSLLSGCGLVYCAFFVPVAN